METFEYRSRNAARAVWDQIREGHPVALRVDSHKRQSIHKTLTLYAEYNRQKQIGRVGKMLLARLAWRTMLAPSLIGLCHHAQASGFGVTVRDTGDALEVRFEKAGIESSR